MMLRVVLRFTLPLAVATVFCLHASAQTADAAALTPTTADTLYGTPVEQIIARVNDRVISNSDLTRAQQQLEQEAHQQNLSEEDLAKQQKNLLRDLIDKQLLLSKGKELGITGDTELIRSLDEIRKQNHLDSMEDLEKAVQAQGTSYEDFKANIRDNIITQNVVRDEVGSKLQPTPEELTQYYEAHKDSFAQPESVHLSEILIPTAADATDAQLATAAAQAQDIEAKLKAGADFSQLAKQFSSGPTAQDGGDLGDFKRGALAKVLEDQTFNLPVGGFTAPIRTKQGYVLLKVTQHTPGGVPAQQEVEGQVEQAVYMDQMEPALRKYLTRLREEAYIDIRPGYTDSGASANETKPIYSSAYVAPLSKKAKKKLKKQREMAKSLRYTQLSKNQSTTAVAAAQTAPGVTPVSQSSVSQSLTQAHPKKKKKFKREKIRYGRAPLYRISQDQVPAAVATSAAKPAPTTAGPSVPDTLQGSEAQLLGQDLTHPVNMPTRQKKTRMSDLAKQHDAAGHAKKLSKKRSKADSRKKKKAKKNQNQPPAATSDELATQRVQSAPLGLAGDTSKKKKKTKQFVGKPGEKIRMSDEQKKKASKKTQEGTPAAPAATSDAPASSSSSSSSAQ